MDSAAGRREVTVPEFKREHDLSWILMGDRGLRAGWSALLSIALYWLVTPVLDTIAVTAYPRLWRMAYFRRSSS